MKKSLEKLVLELLNQSYANKEILARLKRAWAKKHGFMPQNSRILSCYKRLLKDKKVKPNQPLENFLRLKKIRTLSGIVPIAVLTKSYPCPGKCVYCPTEAKMPKSYLSDEPAVMRARMANFEPFGQVKIRLEQLQTIGHTTDKIELIVMGGTFSSLPKDYQVDFISKCFLACNIIVPSVILSKAKNLKGDPSDLILRMTRLKKLQKENEKAKNRIVGLTLETRPDMINEKEIEWFRKLGCTRVEIGVQSIYDSVLKKVKRGHFVEQTIKATRLLKDAGFKVCYHVMPNLPGATLKTDLQMFKTIFSDSRFMPDMLKIYPCVVTYQAKLYQWYKKGKLKPYRDSELVELLIKIKQITPQWIRINRLVRDIPVSDIAAGSKISNLRQVLQSRMREQKIRCNCIRCREIREKKFKTYHLSLITIPYKASGGEEYFLQFVDKNNNLYALLRLRIPSQIFNQKKHFLPVLQNTALIRELHTYGEAVPINKQKNSASQHKGLGKKLLKKAEEIVCKKGLKKIAITSGIGAREYYRKLGYRLRDTYMIKHL